MYNKLNVGAGGGWSLEYDSKEWVKLDIVPAECINVCGDMLDMPFRDNTFEEVRCIHTLEHLTRDKHLPAIKEMYRVLKPSGVCYIEVPDFRNTVAFLHDAFNKHDIRKIHIWTTSVYGKTERKGMAHHFGFYDEKLISILKEASFKDVQVEKEMISEHWFQEPVLLVKGVK